MFFDFVTKHACDGQTDRQNYDPQDRASIAASRGNNKEHTQHTLLYTNSLKIPLTECISSVVVKDLRFENKDKD